MEFFENYGELTQIVEGKGEINLSNGEHIEVDFMIARRNEKNLLFSAICDRNDPALAFHLADGMAESLNGTDNLGRMIVGEGLNVRDTKSNIQTIINGSIGKIEIGAKSFDSKYTVKLSIVNFLFRGNEKRVIKTKTKRKVSYPSLVLDLRDFNCRFEQVENYSLKKNFLKRRGTNQKTANLIVQNVSSDEFDVVTNKVQKLLLLLSVARSTFIYWASCKVTDEKGNTKYEMHFDSITRNYHGNNLISENPADTVSFIEKAWIAYDEHFELFDLKRFLYGYMDTFLNSFIETRSLNIAVLADNLTSRWARFEMKDHFIDNKYFLNVLPDLKNNIDEVLDAHFKNLKNYHKQGMLSKVGDFNRRPLDWKLKRFRGAFSCSFNDDEIDEFIKIRNSLAHNALFPGGIDNKKAFTFMRYILDTMVLRLLNYKGSYFNLYLGKEDSL